MAASLIRTTACVFKFLRPTLVLNAVESRRGVKRYMESYLKELYRKRLQVGPEKLRHRSEWINWNYDAELYAFGKRLGEDFTSASLQTAFTHRSYVDQEEKRRTDLGISVAAAPLGLTDNTELVQTGEMIASRYIKAYLRHVFPDMFEESVLAIHDHLMSTDVLATVASGIGIRDLMLCADFPPESSTLSNTFLAVVGALETDQGIKRAESLVCDLLLAQLIGKDLAEMWTVVNPMGLLMAVLHEQKRGPPEPRLQWQAGQRTVMAVFQIGVYSDQRLIGQSAGETLMIAEEMAARDALQRLMGINNRTLIFRTEAENIEINYDRENTRAEDVMNKFETDQRHNSIM